MPSDRNDPFHRYGEDYLKDSAWKGKGPDQVRRIVLAIGTEPLIDASHLLKPVDETAPTAQQKDTVQKPDPQTEFVLDISGDFTLGEIMEMLSPQVRSSLGFPRIWFRAPGTNKNTDRWHVMPYLGETALELVAGGIAAGWSLTHFSSSREEAAQEMERYLRSASRFFQPAGAIVELRESLDSSVRKAQRINLLRTRFARSVELRLLPAGRPFPARNVWRCAYALGLEWGEMDLFHWENPATGNRLFTLSGLGSPEFFLPERAAEGEGVNGIALGFELPTARAPLQTLDRMALALEYLRNHLDGKPVTAKGEELDGERFQEIREQLEEDLEHLNSLGILPGSPEAQQFF